MQQLTKKRTPKDLRYESMLQHTDNQGTTKLTPRAKEQQLKVATLLKDKDYDCITTVFVCSTAYKGQCQAAVIQNLSSSCFQPCQMKYSS